MLVPVLKDTLPATDVPDEKVTLLQPPSREDGPRFYCLWETLHGKCWQSLDPATNHRKPVQTSALPLITNPYAFNCINFK